MLTSRQQTPKHEIPGRQAKRKRELADSRGASFRISCSSLSRVSMGISIVVGKDLVTQRRLRPHRQGPGRTGQRIQRVSVRGSPAEAFLQERPAPDEVSALVVEANPKKARVPARPDRRRPSLHGLFAMGTDGLAGVHGIDTANKAGGLPRTVEAALGRCRRNAIYCTRSITGRFIIDHWPVFGSHLQLTKQRQLPCSILGLSDRK